MFEKLDVLNILRDRAIELKENNLTKLPDEHKNTSLESGAKCDLSYHQGYRDGIQSLLSIINRWWDNEHDDMQEASEQMYLDYLRKRCANEMNFLDSKFMTKKQCIDLLKNKGLWSKQDSEWVKEISEMKLPD
tara:strand:+ start:2722 stop:3120 length:399 start_codon:yes stop_codon:yes gene_type:complete